MPLKKLTDITCYYEESGSGDSILFIHGLGSDADSWRWQVPHFAEHHRVITYDLRGHGRSSKPPGPYSIGQFAADTAELIRVLDRSPVHVVGISLGGMVAMQFALDFPDCVRSMVLVNCVADTRLNSWKKRWIYLNRLCLVRCLGMKTLGRIIARRLFPARDQDVLRREFIRHCGSNDKRAYIATIKAIAGWCVSDQLHKIRVPVLVLVADHDYTPLEIKQAYTGKMPWAELRIVHDSRHGTPIDQPEEFNQTVGDFLEKISRHPVE